MNELLSFNNNHYCLNDIFLQVFSNHDFNDTKLELLGLGVACNECLLQFQHGWLVRLQGFQVDTMKTLSRQNTQNKNKKDQFRGGN